MINNKITTTKGMEQAQKQMEQAKNRMVLEKKKVAYNDWFANNLAGHARCLLDAVTIFNRPRRDVAILEMDELSLPETLPYAGVDYLIVTNICRDSIRRNAYPSFIKSKIEEAINKKFNQKSDILDLFQWEENSTTDFIYAMLYKKFTFETPFKQLVNGKFNGKGDYKYFGVNDNYSDGKEQVDVLYYISGKYDYAVKLQTKENEEIILASTTDKISNFNDYYKYITEQTDKYEGSKKLNSDENNQKRKSMQIINNIYIANDFSIISKEVCELIINNEDISNAF